MASAPRGPAPAPGGPVLSAARRRVLDTLAAQAAAVTLVGVAELTGSHVNTAREHLDALVAAGLVRRRRATPSGRGRPAWLYEPTGAEPQSEYAALAEVLAGSIARTTTDPAAAGRAAGREWGRRLADDRDPRPATRPGTGRDRVAGLLDSLGFSPRAGSRDELHLTTCPLLEAAREHPEVVCAVHLGIVQGAVERWGDGGPDAALEPFATASSCRLTLTEQTSTRGPAGSGEEGSP